MHNVKIIYIKLVY